MAGLLFGGITYKNMSVIASLGVNKEIKNIIDSDGFVQQHLQAKILQIRGISRRSVRRYCQTNGLRRFSAKTLCKTEQQNALKRARKRGIRRILHIRMVYSPKYFFLQYGSKVYSLIWFIGFD